MWKGCEVLDPENCDIMVQGLVDSLPTGPPSGVQLQTCRIEKNCIKFRKIDMLKHARDQWEN